jgi:hypothetical protein
VEASISAEKEHASHGEQDKTGRALAIAKAGMLAVHAAGKQLTIAAQLQKDVERRRFVALLKRIGSEEAVSPSYSSHSWDS